MYKLIFYSLTPTLLMAEENLFSSLLRNLDTNELNLWVAILLLSVIALISVFYSSQQIAKLQRKYKKKSQISQEEDKILSDMSESIQNIAKDTVETAKKISTYDEDRDISTDIAKVVRSESKLLSITTDILEFLRIKSKKTTIVNEKFKLSNLLNDITGTIKSNTKNLEFELIYDVKSNIPENLYGDTLNLSKIITNIILYCITKGSRSITLHVSKNHMFNQHDHLYFEIDSDLKLNVEESNNLFNSNYDEESQSYESLGLFVANELSILMRGELIARNDKNMQVEFLFNIPFEEDNSTVDSNEAIKSKTILILDSSIESAMSTKNILAELGHSAKFTIANEHLEDMPDFSNYDLTIIKDTLFNEEIVKKSKLQYCKTIALSNIFQSSPQNSYATNANAQLIKPLTKVQISHTLYNLFADKPHKTTITTQQKNTQPILVHRETFINTPNIDLNHFAKFRKTSVLLVEDNLINQKVFIGILSKAGMKIGVANDGQEALDILREDPSYSIIFMDINMPIMDGYTASIKIREDKLYENIPIIALTALTSATEVEKMFDCDMNGFLPKPLKKEQLYTVFSKFATVIEPDRRAQLREPEFIPVINKLNTNVGIENSSANEIFYKEILTEFKDAYGESHATFEKLILDFRYEQLRMLCIDIKGLSGSIGASDMNELITEVLQALLFKKHELIPSFIEPYKAELNELNKSIKSYLA